MTKSRPMSGITFSILVLGIASLLTDVNSEMTRSTNQPYGGFTVHLYYL